MRCVKPVHSGVNRASRSNATRQGFEAEAERNATSKRDSKDRKGSMLAQTLCPLSLGRTSSGYECWHLLDIPATTADEEL